MTSERFYHLSEMIFEAADYLGSHDRDATEHLHETGELLMALAEQEAALEQDAAEQPALPGLGLG
jgi:hypothetical protein